MPADHPDKALEGGSQATPGEFIDWLLDVAEACARVLAPHGSLCIELGDTYAGSGGGGGDYDPGGWREGQEAFEGSGKRIIDAKYERVIYGDHPAGIPNLHGKKQGGGSGWPLAKSLSLIPESFRFAMVYGFNPHTGRTTEPWRLRNVIRWVRPNPPVGALGDKFRPATSELMVFCKSAKRYFDLDSVRSPHVRDYTDEPPGGPTEFNRRLGVPFNRTIRADPAGAPPLDWWNIPLEGEEPSKMGPKERDRLALLEQQALTILEFDKAPRNIPLLEGEEETRYGPKTQQGIRDAGHVPERVGAVQPGNTNRFRGGLVQSNPSGAPPLDWWQIAQVSTLRYPCEHNFYEGHTIIGKERPDDVVSSDLGWCPGGEFLSSPGAPPLDWWEIPPGGYEGAHYAVFPPELCVKPVKAMCPEKVCRQCGEPSRRISETLGYVNNAGRPATYDMSQERVAAGVRQFKTEGDNSAHRIAEDRGFSDCGHDDWRPGLVLDPFAGSGTTLAVATGHGRDAIGIDLDERNFDLALERVGPFILTRGDDD